MKKIYMRPAQCVVRTEQTRIICDSGWETMGPGENNQPAGVRVRNSWNDEYDEDWEEEWDQTDN